MLYDGVSSVSTSPPIPVGDATRTGISSTSRPSSAAPASCAAAAGQDDARGQHPRTRRAHLVADELEGLAHAGFDDPAHLEPADSPARILAQHRDADLLVIADRAEIAGAMADLQLLGDLQARLEPDRDVVRDVVATDRQDPGVERRALLEQARSIVPAPMSATATPSSFSVSVRTASADASELTTSSSILTPAAGDAFGQVLHAPWRRP